MYTGLLHTHSGLRWILLVLLIFIVIRTLMGWAQKKPFGPAEFTIARITFIVSHIQLLLGVILYFLSPIVQTGMDDMGSGMKESGIRFWLVEHPLLMVVGIVLISVGFIKGKRQEEGVAKQKTIAIFYGIALLAILAGIPWDRM